MPELTLQDYFIVGLVLAVIALWLVLVRLIVLHGMLEDAHERTTELLLFVAFESPSERVQAYLRDLRDQGATNVEVVRDPPELVDR